MREVVWQRVNEVSAQPNEDGWASLEVKEVIEVAGLHQAVLDEGKLAASARLYVQQPGPCGAWKRLKARDQVPSEQLIVKVLAPPPGV